MNQAELGRRLREARELCGKSQQEAAEAIDAPRTAITQIEAGNRAVSTLELTRLARLYRVNITHFFLEEENEDISVILHRSESGLDDDPIIKQKIEHCLTLCRKGRDIEKLVMGEAERLPPFYRLATPRNTGEAVAQAEQVAEQERRRLGIETLPIVDMAELLATQGIWVAGTDLPSEVSGLFWHHSSIGLAILVNADHVRARRRFSYAHEYGHALMDRERLDSLNVSSADNASDTIEKRANAFAAAFLMPKIGVSDFLKAMDKGQPSKREQSIFDVATESRIDTQWRSSPGSQTITYKDAASLAHYFGASYQAAVYRLRSLSFLSQKECAELLEQEDFGRSYLHLLGMDNDLEGKDDPSDQKMQKRELRSQIINLAIEAYRREEYSRGQLLALGDDLEFDKDEKGVLLDLANRAKTG